MNKKKEIEEEHVITEREKRAWAKSKERKSSRERPKLDRLQRIEFLKLVSQMASASTMERKLKLEPRDVAFYKRELDIESPDEARRMARNLQAESNEVYEARVLAQTKKAREAEQIANQRLDELDAKRAADKGGSSRRVDVTKIRQEDAERQRRFAAQQAELDEPKTKWELPMEEGAGSEAEQIDRFRRLIIYHGLDAVRRQHGASAVQVKWEAARLGLRINWDIVRG